MGHELYREITTYAPWDWTRGERLVALVIADHCSDRTRRTRRALPRWVLCQETGYTAQGLKRVLQRLAARGFEFRVGHGTGKDGREVFSARGHTVDYQVPHMPKGGTRVPPLPIPVPVDNPEKGGTEIPPIAKKGGTGIPPPAEKGGTGVPERGYGGTPLTPLPPLDDRPVVRGAVEVQSAPLGQEQSRGVEVMAAVPVALPRPMSKIELAAWQVIESRRQRQASVGGGIPAEPTNTESIPKGDQLWLSASCSTASTRPRSRPTRRSSAAMSTVRPRSGRASAGRCSRALRWSGST